jgi:hypothetical protein
MSLAELRSHVPLVNIPKKKKPKKAIRKVSKKRKPVNAEYMRLREVFLKANPYCQYELMQRFDTWDFTKIVPQILNFVAASTEVHHRKGRGKYLLDVGTWMAVSSDGHKAIHNNPKTSYEKGYMLPRR